MNHQTITRRRILAVAQAIENGWDIQTSTHALGDGEWSIEVHSGPDTLFELVGENGTRYPADNLWGEFDYIIRQAWRLLKYRHGGFKGVHERVKRADERVKRAEFVF